MSSLGLSSYHYQLASALRRHADAYIARWDLDDDRPEAPTWESLVEDRMVLTLLVATYIEALANLLLSLNLDAAKFKKAESEPLRRKWTTVPGQFIPGYSFPNSGALAEDLVSLIDRRHCIVHMKPQLSVEGARVHEGNAFGVSSRDHEITLRWLSLPARLIDHIQGQADTDAMFQFRFVSGVHALQGLGQNPSRGG